MFDSVRREKLTWLSRGRLAVGKATLLEGDPGLGKSTLLCEWAARVSRGEALPDGVPGAPRGVVILSAEDGLGDTILPRLEAAGADLGRVAAILSVPDGSPEGRPPTIPRDLPLIARLAREIDAALVIVDPLMAYLDGALDANRDQDARRAMVALKGFAERTGTAVVAVRHLNKGAGTNALYRGGGSIGIIGAARFALLLGADPDDPERRVLAVSKTNFARPPAALAFRLDPVPESEVARLVWLGESGLDARGLLIGADDQARTAVEDAMAWLRDELAGGPLAKRRVEDNARRNGISFASLRRARERLGLVSHRSGFGLAGFSFWSLPVAAAAEPDPLSLRVHPSPGTHVEHVGHELRRVSTDGDAADPAGKTPPR